MYGGKIEWRHVTTSGREQKSCHPDLYLQILEKKYCIQCNDTS